MTTDRVCGGANGRAALYRLQQSHECGQCGKRSRLEVRFWQGEWQCWCPACKATDGFRKRLSLVEQWRRDPESIPWNIRQTLEDKYGRGERPLTSTEIATIDEPTMLARLERARWSKDIAPGDRPIIASLAVQYGLDPVMGELIVYEGKPYITFQGWLRKIQEHPQFAGIADRPMRQEERQAYGYDAPICWIAEIHRHDWKVPAVGTGTADPGKPYRNNPAEKSFPQAMARKRAIIQAAKVGFLHSLPFATMQAAEEIGITVDTRTGEIIGPQIGVRVLTAEEVAAIEDAFADESMPTTLEPEQMPAPQPTARERFAAIVKQVGRDLGKTVELFCDPQKTYRFPAYDDWSDDQLGQATTALEDAQRKFEESAAKRKAS